MPSQKTKIKLLKPATMPEETAILSDEALAFVADLQETFNSRRLELLKRRQDRAAAIRKGQRFDFLPETKDLRQSQWEVGPTPQDLLDRRVEITGPAEAKMMINALNSGARAFMCDFEDSLSPTWSNVLAGQVHLQAAVRKSLTFKAPDTGKEYRLGSKLATLLVRPRGWHLTEKHVHVGDHPLSASLFDFGLAFFHNAKAALERGTGPYFYLPKMESHLEARLWNDVFLHAQKSLGIPRGTIKCTVLIETFPAAFEMDEILYELRDHITGLNAGRWDYIFSTIKKQAFNPEALLPDRGQVTMTVPFMQAYCDLLVRTCHRRGAHAMGGMAAFIPSRKDPEVNRVAMAKVREDKEREVRLGFDGTWVAHPDLVALATEVFDQGLGTRPHQRHILRDDVKVTAAQLTDLRIKGGTITRSGLGGNISVAIQYLAHWLKGTGAVGIFNLMEDAATAEIARAQLWQWIKHGARLESGQVITPDLYKAIRDEEVQKLEGGPKTYGRAVALLDLLVLDAEFAEFLTLPAYDELVS